MQYLKFGQLIKFDSGATYSICLRGARIYDKAQPLSIFTGNDIHTHNAEIISYNHFRFKDLRSGDLLDNYNKNVRSVQTLLEAMIDVYSDFDDREIITILRFTIQ